MSWIGGSISSLTGQLSNLTKDILSEGTEEVSDPATELRVAKGKLGEYEALVGVQKAENDRLKVLIHELEEKSESAELQINSISREYRCLLEEKEKEINELKHKHNEILQHQVKSSLRGPETHQLAPAESVHSLSSAAKDSGFDGSGYQSDDLDFGDNIRLQQEVNRFSQEVQRLKSECHHWKSIASQVSSEDGTNLGNDWTSSKEILDLQAKLQTLEHSLETEKDQHQHEVAALQDLHAQKMATLRRKQKQEVTSLQNQLNNDCDMSALDELQIQLEAVESKLIETRQQLKVITAENNVLQEERLKFNLRIESVSNEVDRYKFIAEDTQKKLENTEQELMDLMQEHSKAQALELIGDLQHLRHQMTSDAVYRRNKLLQEKQEIVEQIIDLGQKQKDLKSTVGDLRGESVEALKRTADIVENLGNAEQQQLTADIMDTLQKENLILKQRNLELQEQVLLLEKAFQTHSEQHQQLDDNVKEMKTSDQTIKDKQTVNSGMSEENPEISRSISLLEVQIKQYEYEIEQFENVKTDWQTEKKALEEVLLQLRDLLKVKESTITALQEQKDDLSEKLNLLKESSDSWNWNADDSANISSDNRENESTTELRKELSSLLQKLQSKEEDLTSAQEEKQELEMSIDELDAQHQEALEQVISIRNSLSKKTEQLAFELSERGEEVAKLKQELEQLKEERVVLREKINLSGEQTNTHEDKITTFSNELQNKVSGLTDKVEQLEITLEEKCNVEKDMTEKLNNAGIALNELHMDKKDLENKLEQSKQQILQKVEKIKDLREENIKLKKSHDSLSKQLNEIEVGIASNNDHDNEQMHIADSELEKLKEGNALLEKEKSELSIKLIDMNAKISQFDYLQSELLRSNESEQSLQRDMESLKLQLEATETEKSKLVEELAETTTNFENQVENHITKIQELEKEKILLKENLDQSHCNYQSEIQQYNLQIQDLCAQKLIVENDLINAHNRITENENKLKDSHASYDSDIANLKFENEKLVEASHDKNNKITELSEQLDDTNHVLSEKEIQVQECTEQLQKREKELQEIISSSDILKCQLSESDIQNEELKENLVHMEQRLLKISENRTTIGSEELHLTDKEVSSSQFQETEENLILVREEKYESIDDQSENQSIEDENKNLKREIELLKNNFNVERKEWESRCSEYSEQLTAISSENSQMNDTLASQMQNFKDDKVISDEEKNNLQLNLKVLEEQVAQLKKERDDAQSIFEEEKENLLSSLHDLEKHLEHMKEENQKFESDLKLFSLQEEKSDVPVKHLEAELHEANEQIERLQDQVRKCQDLIQDHETGISELNKKNEEHVLARQKQDEKIKQQEATITVLQQNSLFKAEEICDIQRKYERASSMLDEKSLKMLENESDTVHADYSLPAIEYMDSSAVSVSEVNGAALVTQEIAVPQEKDILVTSKSVQNLDLLIEDGYETENIAQKLEQLQQVISEKDSVIAELQQNNSSLLKMLESTSASVSGSSNKAVLEIHRLENELRSLKMEKEQILSVMNEKSRECSNLRNEVHQLMNVISAEKAAISKLQKDNYELTQMKNERPVDDMQREALQNLSRLVRDKDVEVEALTQKNETLLALLQETSSDNTQVSALLQDKENLTKQLAYLQSEREQTIAYLNQKHAESLSYHNEIQRLNVYIAAENEKQEVLNKDYQNLVPQFEENKEMLVKTQSEMINFKQKYSDLELKYGELLQRSDAAEVVDAASHNNTVQELNVVKTKMAELQNLLSERDEKIQNLQRQLKELNEKVMEKDADRNSMKKQVDSLEFQVQGLKIELEDLGEERQSAQVHTSEQVKEKQHLQEMNNQLTLKLQEKTVEMKTYEEKLTTLTSILNEQQGAESQVESLMTENEAVRDQSRQFQQERDQAIMALKQLQQDIETDKKEALKMREKEIKIQSELNRLRGHLLQIEEGYTQDALEAEEREKELRNKLIMAEEKLLNSTTAVENASQQASQKMDSLHQQLHSLATQRDQAYLQIAKLQEQCQQYSVSLANLQIVLEQFQKERENQIVMETERYMQENVTLKQQLTNLQSELFTTKERLEEAADGLEAAARLSEQLDRKEEALSALREEVQFRESILKETEEKMDNLKLISEGKVDKFVMKNLFLGYFATPKNKQHEVIQMVGSVLEFSKDDFDKIQEVNRGWVPGFFKFGSAQTSTPPATPSRQSYGMGIQKMNKSFSELFVKFLEKESSPPPPTVRLPAEEMARDVEKQREAHRPTYNPFTAPRHVVSGQSPTSNAHILMSNESVSSPLPLFLSTDSLTTSTPRSESGFVFPTTSSAILKDVLEPH